MVALQLMSVSDRQIYLIGSRLNMVALQHTIYTASGNTCGSSRLNMVALQQICRLMRCMRMLSSRLNMVALQLSPEETITIEVYCVLA